MNTNEYKFYQTLSRATQTALLEWTKTYLTGIFSEERVIATEDYTYAIGDIPVMLVAHLDTVHVLSPTDMFFDKEQKVIWSPQGLGADDRAGVYAILSILMKGFRPHILFTTDEETGGVGARIAATQLKPDLNFVIELDRRGKEDSVFYDCDNPDFENYINGYGFITNTGSFSDISYLCPEWKVAGVNLSIGYLNEHTKTEMLLVDAMENTIRKVCKILGEIDIEKNKYEYIDAMVNLGGGYSFLGGWDNYYKKEACAYYDRKLFEDDTDGYRPTDEICYECFNGFHSDLIIKTTDGKFCGDCYAKLFTTCIKCGTDFKDRTKTHLHCEKCRKEA